MTNPEILEWLGMLSPLKEKQRTIVTDLLRHANEDQMSVDDRLVCLQALTLIG